MKDKKFAGYEMPHYTEHDLYAMDKEVVVWAYCLLQDKFEHLRDCEYVDPKERYRILTVKMFGRSSEKSKILNGEKSKAPDTEINETEEKKPGCRKRKMKLPMIMIQI